MADVPRKRPPGPGRGHKKPQGTGMGWGGEAKGASTSTLASIQVAPQMTRGLFKSERGSPERKAMEAERSDVLEDRLYAVAMARDAEEAQPVQVMAATKLHAIYNGEAVQRGELSGKDGGPIEQRVALENERANAALSIIAQRLAIAKPADAGG